MKLKQKLETLAVLHAVAVPPNPATLPHTLTREERQKLQSLMWDEAAAFLPQNQTRMKCLRWLYHDEAEKLAALEEAILKGAERSPDWTIPVGSIPAMADFSDVDSPREGQGTVESFQAVACASMDGSPCTEQQPREAHGREPSNRGETTERPQMARQSSCRESNRPQRPQRLRKAASAGYSEPRIVHRRSSSIGWADARPRLTVQDIIVAAGLPTASTRPEKLTIKKRFVRNVKTVLCVLGSACARFCAPPDAHYAAEITCLDKCVTRADERDAAFFANGDEQLRKRLLRVLRTEREAMAAKTFHMRH